MHTNLLFICNLNKHRSKTAEELFSKSYPVKSAGLYSGNPLTEKLMKWADLILVMDDEQRNEVSKRFPELYIQKRILSLDVPDTYHYNQPELIHVLEQRMKKALHSS